MATLTKVFSDIDFTFTPKPVTGDVALSYDQQAVIRSIRNLILTRPFEKKFNPDIGSSVDALLFEPSTIITSTALENEISNVIKNWEPRASLQSVRASVNPDQNSYNITITFFVINQATPTTITVLLERNR